MVPSRDEGVARPHPVAWLWRLGAFVAVFIASTMLARVVRFGLTGRARLPAGATATAEPYFLLYRATGVAAALLATWLAIRFLDGRRLAHIGLGSGARGAVREAAKGAALVTGIFVAGFAGLVAIGQARVVAAVPDWRLFALQAVPATALVGVYEELLFRGYPFQVLVERFRAWAAILVVALTFGALHYPNPGMSFGGADGSRGRQAPRSRGPDPAGRGHRPGVGPVGSSVGAAARRARTFLERPVVTL